MEIIWTYRVGNEEVLHTVKGQNILQRVRRRKANWIGHILLRQDRGVNRNDGWKRKKT
jgi:hypothetical protein